MDTEADNARNESSRSDLVPGDATEATQRLETVIALEPALLADLERKDLLLAWWSFFWLNAGLHPDDAEVWPEKFAHARPVAAEALRRYRAGEIADDEYYPVEAVRRRILHERSKPYPPTPPADPQDGAPQRPTLPNA